MGDGRRPGADERERITSYPLWEHVPVYAVKLVRVDSLTIPLAYPPTRPRMNTPQAAAELLWRYLRDADREHFVALLLDVKGGLIGITTISIGDLSSTVVHPREVFKPAILANAAAILIAHNHPSGDPTPSPEDTAITQRIGDAGDLLGIGLIDHLIIAGPDSYTSLKTNGLL